MKTFKLIMLKILSVDERQQDIPLLDGLIINREDDLYPNQWLIEAYVSKQCKAFFEKLKEENELMIQVKITKTENDPVVFKSSIIGINDIGTDINVLFKGEIDNKSGT
ncbi:YwpF family protein [Oceanobacillus salinisoli]|uniref:YwpF family protein n=1 Tax=Oceanobacillus salinisoli TaxID=2678611 RepID=UPI0012E18583|nr:YwpF family protein [Oceanobacillus salinisoli]